MSRVLGQRTSFLNQSALGVLDQIVSSVTNFVVVAVAARLLTASDFGELTVAFAIVIMGSGLLRNGIVEPFMVDHDPQDEDSVPFGTLLAGLALGLPVLLVGLAAVLSGLSIGIVFVWASLGIPSMGTFEALRLARIRRQATERALVMDAVWLALSVFLLVLAWLSGVRSVTWFLLAWLGPPNLVSLVMLVRARARLSIPKSIALLRRNRSLGTRLAGDFALGTGAQQVSALAVALVLTLSDFGALRLAISWYGPIGILFAGLAPVLLSELGRRRQSGEPLPIGLLFGFSAILTSGLVAFAMISYFANPVRSTLLGTDAASRIKSLMLPTASIFFFNAIGSAAFVGLRSLGRARDLIRIRVVTAPFAVVTPLATASFAGAKGAALATGAVAGAGACLAWSTILTLPPAKEVQPSAKI